MAHAALGEAAVGHRGPPSRHSQSDIPRDLPQSRCWARPPWQSPRSCGGVAGGRSSRAARRRASSRSPPAVSAVCTRPRGAFLSFQPEEPLTPPCSSSSSSSHPYHHYTYRERARVGRRVCSSRLRAGAPRQPTPLCVQAVCLPGQGGSSTGGQPSWHALCAAAGGGRHAARGRVFLPAPGRRRWWC